MGIKNKKLWLDRQNVKIQKKKSKLKKRKQLYKKTKIKKYIYKQNTDVYIAELPSRFSFLENSEETIEFFSKTIDEMRKKAFKRKFYFDSSKVIFVTNDAIVYLIAIMKNIRINRIYKYSFQGNLPNMKDAKNIFLKSGFLNYVNSKYKSIDDEEHIFQIKSGKANDPIMAGNICKFIQNKVFLDKNNEKIRILYKTFIELMDNAVHHAYTNDEIMEPCWYSYLEYNEKSFKLVFLDTGFGIAKTVRKKTIIEKIDLCKDSQLIEYAFSDVNRTATRLSNRGLGLPEIKKYALNKYYTNFLVASGSGIYKQIVSDKNIDFIKIEYKKKIYGTIYILEMSREDD